MSLHGWIARTAVCASLCGIIGCQPPEPRSLDLGGVFWPCSTPGYATEAATRPAIEIPRGSICHVRIYPENTKRGMVKVLVGDVWLAAWVDRIPDLDHEAQPRCLLPFETFAFYSWSRKAEPDLDWALTQRSLLETGRKEQQTLTDKDLRIGYGEKTFERYGKPSPIDPPAQN